MEKLINKEKTFHMLSDTIYLLIDLTIITFFMLEQTEKGSLFISAGRTKTKPEAVNWFIFKSGFHISTCV